MSQGDKTWRVRGYNDTEAAEDLIVHVICLQV
jgi:hypothetical protein